MVIRACDTDAAALKMFRDGKNVYTEHFQTEANETDPNLAPGTTKIK